MAARDAGTEHGAAVRNSGADDLAVVKIDLTFDPRHENLDTDDDMPSPNDPVTAKVAEAARRLVDELDHPGSPSAAVVAARDLSAAAEAALQRAVDRARSAGQTWRDVGHVLGTSRQAAFQRFGHPVDPRTGVAVTRAAQPAAAEQVTEFLNRFTSGRWDEVLESLNDVMRERHDPSRLGSGWAHLVGMFGRYQGMGDVSPVSVGDSTIVDVLLRFEAGEAMVWARFDRDGKVSGLRLHPPSA